MSKKILNKKFESLIKNPLYSVNYDISLALLQEGLKEDDFIEICYRLKRSPNRTELGMFGVMWSEHCCYRNSKPLLNKFPTKGKHILVGPGENAGVVDLGKGQRLAFKIESHNHPSAIEPFQGAATGVGGILRDIFTMGARPIALLNALRFGPIEKEKNISLLEGVVAGIAHYGNCVGVPTIGGEVAFDNSYSGNPLVNAMAMGLMETEEIVCSGAEGVDFPVIYVGSTTGRDGMGGASFASAELTNSSLDDRPAVQVGDPFLEKGLIEACLDSFKAGDVIAAQDMGAAGLTCSCSEMAAKGGLGIEIDLDLVPAREEGMTPYEFLLSESQERMLFVVKPDRQDQLTSRFKKWGLKVSVVGKVLKDNIVRVIQKGKIVAELPASALADDTPINKHNLITKPPIDLLNKWKWNENDLPKPTAKGINVFSENSNKQINILSWNQILLRLLDDPTIASKRWIYSQYDYQVQGNTILAPGKADAALIRLRSQVGFNSLDSSNRGIAAVVDCPNRWVFLDPERGSMAAVAEAARNLSCVGAKPLAITNNLNFPSPNNSFGYWQLASSCEGISKACKVLDTPVTGGNVSLFNETRLSNGEVQPIQPTPVIGMVGIVEDINKICTYDWKKSNDLIWMLGVSLEKDNHIDSRLTLAGTSYLEVIHKLVTGRPPKIDLELDKLIQAFLRKAIENGYINSAHDVSDGGIAIALAESCIASSLGAHWDISFIETRLDRILFAEGGSRVIVSVDSSKESEWINLLNEINDDFSIPIPAIKIGKVIKDERFMITSKGNVFVDLALSELTEAYENSIPTRIASNNSLSV